MPKTFAISKEQAAEIKAARKGVKDKKADKRLHAVQLRGEGLKNRAIASKLDASAKVVSRWASAYCEGGIGALMGGKHGGNHRNMSFAEEAAFLDGFKKQAEQGQIIEVGAIRDAYEEKVGHSIGGSQAYRVLERHGWRKVMPRSKHPYKASDGAIDASKKLTRRSGILSQFKARKRTFDV
jgi:transposase